MTDRELLELAAKAAGVDAQWDCPERGMMMLTPDGIDTMSWNSLTDDRDALRLFCTFPWLCIETSDLAATVRERGKPDEPSRVYLMWTEWLDGHKGDLTAATRRAITRAAAEIGRNMK